MAKILRDSRGANLPIEQFPKDILKIIDDVLKGKNQIIVNYTLDEINEVLKPLDVKIGKAALSNRIKQLNLNNKILRGRIPGVDYKPVAIGPKNEIVKNFVEDINSKIAQGIQNENLSKIYKVDLGTDLAKALGKNFTSKQALSVFSTYNTNRANQPKLNLPALTDLAEARTNLGKDLTTKANQGIEYISKESILEKIGKRGTAWDTEKYGKLESLNDKGIKAVEQIFSNPTTKAEDLFNPLEKIAKLVRPGGSIVAAKAGSGDRIRIESLARAIKEKYPDYYSLIKKLSNPTFKNRVLRDAKKDRIWSLEDVEMARRSGINVASPSNIYDRLVNYAVRHYAQSKPGESLIQLFDENGKVITNVEDINSFKNITFKYRPDTSVDFRNIKNVYGTSRGLVDTPPKSTFVDLTFQGRDVPEFKEYFNKIDQIEDLRIKDVIHPVTKKPVKFSALMGETYKTGANYEDAFKRFPYEVDHKFGVAADPFKNLRVIPRRLNIAAGQASQWNPEYLKKMGYEFDKDPVRLFEDELKLADDVLRKGRRLRTAYAPAKEFVEKGRTVASQYVPSDEFLDSFIQQVKSVPGGCQAVVKRALGATGGLFNETCETIIRANPKAAAVKLNNAITATKGPLKDLKNKSQKLANLLDTGQVTTADKVPQPEKSILRDDFKEANVRWNNDVGAFETANGNVATQEDLKLYAEENPMEVKVGTEPPTPNKSVLKTVGKTLAKVGAPLPTALIDGYFINKQIEDGKSTAEIAKDPLNWIGLAAMEPLSKVSGVAEKGGLNAVLRLGLNPATIRGISRFAGLPGLAISTAMTAYDQYKKYQNEEGFVYNLFNKEGT